MNYKRRGGRLKFRVFSVEKQDARLPGEKRRWLFGLPIRSPPSCFYELGGCKKTGLGLLLKTGYKKN